MKKAVLILCALLPLIFSCEDPEEIAAITSLDTIRMEMTGKVLFTFDPLTWQYGFDEGYKEYRVHKDDVSEYFTIRFSHVPEVENEFVTATVTWTASGKVETRKNLTFQTLSMDAHRIWLYNRSYRLTLVLPVIE